MLSKKMFFLFIVICFTSFLFSHKVIVTAPNIAEMIALLGKDDTIVAITKECDYPEKMKNKPVIGNFGNVKIEEVIKLEPDIVFLTGLEQAGVGNDLNKLGIKTKILYTKSIEDIYSNLRFLAKFYSVEDVAEDWIEKSKKKLNKDKSAVKKRVYIEIYGNPLMTVSDETYIAELINLSGGENIFSVLPREYCRISSEEIIENNPEIIIALYPNVTKEQIKNRMGWENIMAVKKGNIYTSKDINPDIILRPGPRIIDAFKELKRIINEKN